MKKFISTVMVILLVSSNFIFNGTFTTRAAEINKKHVINITWDGLSSSLYNSLKSAGANTPNIDELISRGTKIDNVKTTVPSYGGAQAAIVTGAYPQTNGMLYRYYDKSTNTIITDTKITYKLNAKTIMESLQSQKPDLKTLVLGMNVAGLSLEGRGVSKTDANHTLKEYANGDALVKFSDVSSDLVNSINSGISDYTLTYSNDIKMSNWNGGATDDNVVLTNTKNILETLDASLGNVINALKVKGEYDNTIIILNSLSSVYTTKTKIDGIAMAADITTKTGVKTTFGTVASDGKAVIVKTYVMKYAQLYFTNKATDTDKNTVIAYLNDKTSTSGKPINNIITPADVNAPTAFADYILNPIKGSTFSAAGSNSFRTDNLDDMEQFCVVSGIGVIKNSTISNANLVDIVPTISTILGVNAPSNNEGNGWSIFDFQKPTLNVKLDGTKDSNGLYESSVKVSVNAADNRNLKVQYDMGNGFVDYTAPFIVNKDCNLKVRAFDDAGNVVEDDENIKFIKVIDNISFTGDYSDLGDKLATDSNSITVSGDVLADDSNVIIKINGQQTKITSKKFIQDVMLINGENKISITSELNGLTSTEEKYVYKIYEPTFNSIKDGDVVSQSSLEVKGIACPYSILTINNKTVPVDNVGNFTENVDLVIGDNEINAVSTIGKYAKTSKININYYTPVVVNISNIVDKMVVKTDKITIKGSVDKTCEIKVNNEVTTLNNDLTFEKMVNLAKGINTINIQTNYKGVISTKSIKVDYVLIDDKYVVYINWDGFAKYYYDEASKKNMTPILDSIIKQGVFFENAYTGIPSITNAMQPAIVSGTYSSGTGNCYRYFDKKNNVVVQFARENNAETIAEAAVRQGLTTATVHQFALQDKGTTIGDVNKAYIQANDPADYSVRFDEAINLIKGLPAGDGASQIEIDDIPRFIALYMDDLDAFGHNEEAEYGVSVVSTEQDRKDKVEKRLSEMDSKLGEFINACKDRGIYDNMSFILTTDHGMAPFGQQGTEADDYGMSKLPDLVQTIQNLGYKVEVLFGGQSAQPDTDIAIVDVGLQAQLSFTKSYTADDISKIVNAVKDKVYVGKIMQKDELISRGCMDDFADMLISPKAPYSFKTDYTKFYIARGQHDSLDEQAQHIFSIMWGNGIKAGVDYTDRIYNIDFARTMAELLNIDGPKNATGALLYNTLTYTQLKENVEAEVLAYEKLSNGDLTTQAKIDEAKKAKALISLDGLKDSDKTEFETRISVADGKVLTAQKVIDENLSYAQLKANVETKVKAYEDYANEDLTTQVKIDEAKKLKALISLDGLKDSDKTEFETRISAADGKVLTAQKVIDENLSYAQLKANVETKVKAYEDYANGDLTTQVKIDVAKAARLLINLEGLNDADKVAFVARINFADSKITSMQKSTDSTKEGTIVKTGSYYDSFTLLSLSIIILAAGIVFVLIKKNKKA